MKWRAWIFDAKETQNSGMNCHPGWSSNQKRLQSLARLAVLLTVVIFPAFRRGNAQSASTWNKRGQAAELREDYDTAYEDYLKAHQKNPKDMRYTARVDRMRFQAAASHVDRGRVLRQNGDIAGALNQFSRALEIDPGNEAAAQEIRITQQQDKGSIPAALPPPGTADSTSVQREIASIAGPIQLKSISDEPITLNMTEDAKNIYTAIGKIAGLNVLFDPDYNSRRIPFNVNNVSLPDALRILGAVSGTFYKVVTPDTILVAQNTKHKDLDDLAVQTFYLTNPTAASDANEIYTALRQMLPPDVKSYLVPSQNAIIVRGTQDDLMLTEKLLNDLDRTKPEVVVDVAILEVNRDKIRNLGITLPQSVTVTPQASSSTTSTTSNTTNGTTTTSGLTLNTLANMNATNFAVSISGGTVNALLSDADTRVLQNPSIRATDGQEAVLKIGSKIPIATGSYSAGAATGITAGIGVQTQFSYIDVGVTIDITPTIHLDHEVSLKLNVENSTETSSVTIEGVTEPVIGTRSDKAVIQLRDGEPCLLAGILTKQDNSTNSGTPGLSDIPLLKYFFGSVYKENSQDEVVFILIPHIVRESVLTPLNTRAIDTGTNTDIQLRRSSTPIEKLFPETATPNTPVSSTSAAQAASAMVQQMRQQAMPSGASSEPSVAAPQPASGNPNTGRTGVSQTSPATPKAAGGSGASPASSVPISMLVVPPRTPQSVGSTFQASIVAANARDLYSVPLELKFDPKILQLVNVEAGGLLGGDGQPVAVVHRDEGNGTVTISASRPPGANGVNGQGQVCLLTFKALKSGDSKLTLTKVGAKNSLLANLPAVGSQATVQVK